MPTKEVIEDLIYKYRWQAVLFFGGLTLLGVGIILQANPTSNNVQVLDTTDYETSKKIVIEISGEVVSPGVYDFDNNARVDDAIKRAGGITDNADTDWISRFLNKAAILEDSQKIFIPSLNQSGMQSANNFGTSSSNNSDDNSVLGTDSNYVNINTASKSELESMWGIGPVYAQNIIEQRPYSSVKEVLDRGVVKQNVYDRNKDIMTVY